MSSGDETSAASATTTPPHALTTPFVPPINCEHYTPISIDATVLTGPHNVPVVLASSADPSCHPEGWANTYLERNLYFSPGVCPSGWSYNFIAEEHEYYSSAWCCQSGFTIASFEYSELVAPLTTLNCGRLTTHTASGDASATLLVHQAWLIGWASSDTSTMSPEPPTLTNRMRVPTWTPGEVIPDGKWDRDLRGSDRESTWFPQSVVTFLMIGLPIIVAALIGSCVFCCVRSNRRKKTEARLAAGTGQVLVPLKPS